MIIRGPLVSVIMNCYNGEKFLKESLKSLKKQSYKNWELIFFDNCSIDRSLNILKEFKDKRIKIFKTKKTLNLYHARKLALKKASGKYISFLDVDDLWSAHKIYKQLEFLKKNKKYKFVYSNYYVKKELKANKTIKFKKKLKSGKITQDLLNNYTIGILTVLFERSLLKKYFFNTKYNIIGDFDLFVKISKKNNIGYIQEPLATYRYHDNNYTSKNLSKYILEYDDWFKNNKKKYLRNNYTLFSQYVYFNKLKIKFFLKKYLGV